jgi:hypothetical protein
MPTSVSRVRRLRASEDNPTAVESAVHPGLDSRHLRHDGDGARHERQRFSKVNAAKSC